MKRLLTKNDYVFSIINKGVSAITGFIVAALINRYLGPSLKGEYAYLMNVVNIAAIIGNFGIYQSYPKSYKDRILEVKNKYVSLVLSQFVVYTVLAAILGIISGSWLYTIAFLIVPSQVTANQLSMIVMVEQIRFRQYVQILTLIFKTIITLVVELTCPTSLVIVLIIILFINILQSLLYLWKLHARCSIKLLTRDFIRYTIKFGIYAAVADLLLIFNYKADVLMLKYYVDYYQIGLYSVGAGIAECIWLIPDAFKEVLFSRTSRGNPISEINFTIKINMFVSIVLIIIMFIFGKEVLLIYSGREYLGALSVTRIILLGVPALSLFKVTNPLYLANGKQKLYCYILLVSVIANIIMNLIAIPLFGINGAALASVVAFSVCGIAFYGFYVKEYGIKWYEPLILKPKDLKIVIDNFKRS